LLLTILSACSKAPLPTAPGQNPDGDSGAGHLFVAATDERGQPIDSARVYLNGQFLGFTTLTKKNIDSGIHSLRIQKDGFEIFTQSVAVGAAQSVYVEALLKRLPSNKGQLLITVDQDSALTTLTNAQNELIGVTFSREKTFVLEAGGYFLKTEKPGYRLIHLAVEIPVDSIIIENLRLEKLEQPQLPEMVLLVPDSAEVNEAVVISWESKNADRVDIDYIENPGLSGRREVAFRSAGWRTITARATNQYATSSVVDSIFIYERPTRPRLAPQLSFQATPAEAEFGEPIRLNWSSDALYIIIDHGIGLRASSGTEEIMFQTPGQKIITATAYGEAGLTTVTRDTVVVNPPRRPQLPIVALAVADSVQVGMPVTVEWHSQNAVRVDVDYVPNPGLNGKAEVIFQSPGRRIITATAYNAAGQSAVAETLYVMASPVLPQVTPFLVDLMAKVCAFHPTVPSVIDNAGTFQVERSGHYRVRATVWYDSGDAQKNESFFILIKDATGNLRYPEDANAGRYKVVADEAGPAHVSFRDAGLFYLPAGLAQIQLHHYQTIASQYPQFVVDGPITGAESVEVISLKIEFVGP
ncbi:MAG: PEGA domain-containing protein, partial [candidate division KSB1 bacterium]|nr:PEGA domain-containing protein [candidate division KSB1 bacterium]